jgi:uncharacterized protein (TIGR02147 family)
MKSYASVFNYSVANRFLKDALEQKKASDPKFSLRVWAKQMGLKEHTPLHLMLNGRRGISKKYIPFFVRSLNLNSKEASFLEILIELERAKDPTLKSFYLDRLNKISPRRTIKVKELEDFKYWSDPIHMILREMVDHPEFTPREQAIQKRLRPHYSLTQIKDSVSRLKEMKLLVTDAKLKLRKKDQHLTSSKDIQSSAIRQYHQKSLDFAKSALEDQSVQEREFNSYVLNMNKKDIPEAKQWVRTFIKQFISKFESSSGQDLETFQLSQQLFSLTKSHLETNKE